MAGCLDNKSRVIDTIVTEEGRRQISSGKLRIEHVAFSDLGVYYAADAVSGSIDVSSRLTFEADSLSQDSVVYEADDSGHLKPFKFNGGNSKHNDKSLKDGQIVSYSFSVSDPSVVTGSNQTMVVLSGTMFNETFASVLGSSHDSFRALRIIGSIDVDDDEGFLVSSDNVEFVLSDKRPLQERDHVVDIDSTESLFNDRRLSNLLNFRFLPPIDRVDDDSIVRTNSKQLKKFALGEYRSLSNSKRLTSRDIESELAALSKIGFCKTLTFDPTSSENNLLCQVFEVGDGTLRKLDVIDFGSYNQGGSVKRAFFLGKVYVDGDDLHSFMHLFTLVFG